MLKVLDDILAELKLIRAALLKERPPIVDGPWEPPVQNTIVVAPPAFGPSGSEIDSRDLQIPGARHRVYMISGTQEIFTLPAGTKSAWVNNVTTTKYGAHLQGDRPSISYFAEDANGNEVWSMKDMQINGGGFDIDKPFRRLRIKTTDFTGWMFLECHFRT